MFSCLGYVIREGPTPFPVSRQALLSDALRREHEALFGTDKERKRKVEASSESSHVDDETTGQNDEKVCWKCCVPFEGCNFVLRTALSITRGARFVVEAPRSHRFKPFFQLKEATPASETGAQTTKESTVNVVSGQRSSEAPNGEKFGKVPRLWNVHEVFEFINSISGCAAYAEEFRAQEIDGEALLILKEESFAKIKNMKLGPAAKICMRLDQMQS